MTQRKAYVWIFIVFFVLCAAIVGIGISMATSGCASTLESTPNESVRGQPKEVKDAYRRQGELMRAWYWMKSEKEFWRMVSRRGPLDRIRDRNIFFSAFTKPIDQVNTGNRTTDSGPFLSALSRTDASFYEVLSQGYTSFALVRMDLKRMRVHPRFRSDAGREEAFFGDIPDSEYLISGYGIQGEGYAPRLVIVVWVREEGTWMIWNILLQEFTPEGGSIASSSFLTYPRFGV